MALGSSKALHSHAVLQHLHCFWLQLAVFLPRLLQWQLRPCPISDLSAAVSEATGLQAIVLEPALPCNVFWLAKHHYQVAIGFCTCAKGKAACMSTCQLVGTQPGRYLQVDLVSLEAPLTLAPVASTLASDSRITCCHLFASVPVTYLSERMLRSRGCHMPVRIAAKASAGIFKACGKADIRILGAAPQKRK